MKFCTICVGTQQSTSEVYTTGSYSDAEAQEYKICKNKNEQENHRTYKE